MPDIAFFTSTSFTTQDSSDRNILSWSLQLESSAREVNEFLASNIENKSVTSFSEMFCPYTTIDESGMMPIAIFEERDDETEDGDDVWNGYLDSRMEILSIDIASGVNVGIIPTFEDYVDIYDKNDVVNINSMAFRNPMMISGFGYDTEGLPVPSKMDQNNQVDDEDEGDNDDEEDDEEAEDEEDDDSDDESDPDEGEIPSKAMDDAFTFADDVRNRPDLWVAGPLDMRWDKYKKMFVAAPEMFIGYALCDIPAASGRYAPLQGTPSFTSGEIECAIGRWDAYCVPSGAADDGTAFSLNKLLIINRSVSMDISSGVLVVATRLNNGEYFPIYADCTPDVLQD